MTLYYARYGHRAGSKTPTRIYRREENRAAFVKAVEESPDLVVLATWEEQTED